MYITIKKADRIRKTSRLIKGLRRMHILPYAVYDRLIEYNLSRYGY